MKGCDLRQHLITALCYVLRVPFALFDLIRGPFIQRARQHPQSIDIQTGNAAGPRLRASHVIRSEKKIVVIKPCCLGDVVMTTPLLEVLHQAYPDASITYVVGTWSKVIAEHHPAVTAVIDSGTVGIPGHYHLKDYLAVARQLRKHRFDLAFVLDRSPLVTLLPFLAGVPRRVGPDSLARGFSLTDRVPVSFSPAKPRHEAEIYLDLARAIGLPVNAPRMRFVPTEEERQSVPTASRVQVAVFPGGGSNPGMELTAKRWPLERYREIARRLVHELDMQVLLIGGPGDVALNDSLLEGLDVPDGPNPSRQGRPQGSPLPRDEGGMQGEGTVTNIAGKTTIGQLAAYLERCALFIGNDSSPMHLAAAVGIPVIAIFGPTSPEEYGPYPLDDPKHIVLWRHPTGQPCFFLGQMGPHMDCTCMQAVTVDDVWAAVQRLIPSTRRGVSHDVV